ncbi:MAG: EI24 domain-containing protein [Bacteroidota bacterium]|nr:MAG: EI24 domain-containing protein [Bacteroidota bacterium]
MGFEMALAESDSALSIFLSTGILFLSIFKYIYLTLASPLYAYISERTASSYSGQTFAFSLAQFLSDILRGMRLSLINLFRQTFSVLFFFSLILCGGLFSLILILLDSYYYGFSMLDYNCERDRFSVSTARTFIRQHRGLAIGNGLPFYFSIMIPVLGVCIMAPLSCIAATLSYEQLKASHGKR